MNPCPFAVGTKQPTILKYMVSYLVEPEPLGAVEAVQVLVRLPYCLYIPSTRYLFNLPNSDEVVGIVPEKVWTARSEGSTSLSSELVVANESVHLAGGRLVTDWMGEVAAQTGAAITGIVTAPRGCASVQRPRQAEVDRLLALLASRLASGLGVLDDHAAPPKNATQHADPGRRVAVSYALAVTHRFQRKPTRSQTSSPAFGRRFFLPKATTG